MASQPKKCRFSIGERLYQQYEAKEEVETMIIVASRKLYVHRNVLIGVSDKFRECLNHQKKNGVKQGVIQFPTEISFDVAKAFIKVMYMQNIDVDTCANFDQVLGVLSLCDMWLVPELLEECVSFVCDKIDVDNCVQVCEASFKLERSQHKLAQAGLVCLTRNISTIFDRHGTTMSHKLWDMILHIEGPDVDEDDLSETRLFEYILKWRQSDASREEEFQKLLSLIRFPLMTVETIARIVEPSGVLSDTDLADIYTYIAGGGANGKRTPRFVTHSRKVKFVESSEQLDTILSHAKPNDFIKLNSGEYKTETGFIIPEKVVLSGAADGSTILRKICSDKDKPGPAVLIESNDVRISNVRILSNSINPFKESTEAGGLTLLGSRNIVKNVTFEKCLLHLTGKGRHNKVHQVTCEKGEIGIKISGEGQAEPSRNYLSGLKLKSLAVGILVNDTITGTRINDIHCADVTTGIMLYSNNNIVSGLMYVFSSEAAERDQVAVEIYQGNYNTVNNIMCEPTGNVKNTYAIKILTSEKSQKTEKNEVSGCVGGAVYLGGECNSLHNVDASDILIISGKGHKLENCTAKDDVQNNCIDLVLNGCQFVDKSLT